MQYSGPHEPPLRPYGWPADPAEWQPPIWQDSVPYEQQWVDPAHADPRCWSCKNRSNHWWYDHWRNLALAQVWHGVDVSDVLQVRELADPPLPDTGNGTYVLYRQWPARPGHPPGEPTWRYMEWTGLYYVTMTEAIRTAVNNAQLAQQAWDRATLQAAARGNEVNQLEARLAEKRLEQEAAVAAMLEAEEAFNEASDTLTEVVAAVKPTVPAPPPPPAPAPAPAPAAGPAAP